MKLDHIAIQVKNIESTIDWYQNIFNCKILEPEDRLKDPVFIYFMPNLAFAMFEDKDTFNWNMIAHFWIEVSREDFDTYKMKIKDLWIEIRETSHSFPVDVDTFYIRDINWIELELFTNIQ